MANRRRDPIFRIRSFRHLTGLTLAILFMNLPLTPATGAEANRSLIFVIDSSVQMAPHLVDIRGLIFTVADQAKQGDHIGMVSFSETAKKIGLKKISSQRDAQSVALWLDAVGTEGESGNIALGLVRALEEVEQLNRKHDRNPKGVVIISASQYPDTAQTADILKNAQTAFPERGGSETWYIQYCYLNGIKDRQIETFVSQKHGLSYDIDALKIEQGAGMIEELYRIISTPEKICPAKLRDVKGTILGKGHAGQEWIPYSAGASLSEEDEFRVASDSRAVIEIKEFGKIGMDPETDLSLVSTRKGLLTGTGILNINLRRGSVWMLFDKAPNNILSLKTTGANVSLSGKSGWIKYFPETHRLNLASFSHPFSARIMGKVQESISLGPNESVLLESDQTFDEKGPIEAGVLERWKFWRRVLAENAPLASLNFVVPEVTFPEEAVTIGPVKSGKTESRELVLRLSGVDDPAKLKMDVHVSLALPEGLALTTGIVESDEPDAQVLLVKVDGSRGFRSAREDMYPGFINISPATNSQILFEKISIPVTITTKGPLVPKGILIVCGGALVVGAVALGARLMLRSAASVRPKPHSVVGRLITVNDPTGGRIGTVNMEEVGTKSSRLSLVVGRDKAVDIRLKHASVSHEHCTIEAYLVGGRLETLIEPVGSAKVEINGETIGAKTRLNDGDKINLGEFTYQFEDSQFYKKVEVMRRNGRRISGILDAAGMDAEGFRVSPMDAVSPSERARINFLDIRYAVFYRRVADIISGTPRVAAKTDTMKKVEFMFRKGDTISGYVQREYMEGRRKFAELIPLDPESTIDYTIVDLSAVMEKKSL